MKFKVGDIYRDREGNKYKLIAHLPEALNQSELVFLGPDDCNVHTRYLNGKRHGGNVINDLDILPPETKTVKLYQALHKTNCGAYYTDYLYETCPEDAIRLITEYPPVIIEVEDE